MVMPRYEFVFDEIYPPFNFSLSAKRELFAPWSFSRGRLCGGHRLKSGKIVGIVCKMLGTVHEPSLLVKIESEANLTDENRNELVNYLQWSMGLKEDLHSFYQLAQKDPVLARAVNDLYGMRIFGSTVFRDSIVTICSQNTTFDRAISMINCLVSKLGEKLSVQGRTYMVFPSQRTLANAPIEELRRCKVGYRAKYIKSFATEFQRVGNEESWKSMETNKLRNMLLKIKGVGPYTADVILLFSFRRYEVMFIDAFVRKVFQHFFFAGKGPSDQDILSRSNKWGVYRGLALHYILTDTDNLSKIFRVEVRNILLEILKRRGGLDA